jgi:hypothetical protein
MYTRFRQKGRIMLRYWRVIVFLCFVATCAIGAGAQVLSYSTYAPKNTGPQVSIAVDDAGDACAALINAPPLMVPKVSGAKFRSDGSVVYTISALHGPTLVEAIDSMGNWAGADHADPRCVPEHAEIFHQSVRGEV